MKTSLSAGSPFASASSSFARSISVVFCVLAATAALGHAGGIRGHVTKNGKAMSYTQVAVAVGGQTTYVTTDGAGFYRCELAKTLAGHTAVAYVTSKKSHKATIAVPPSGYNTLNLSYRD
jgi:hypothetical protein